MRRTSNERYHLRLTAACCGLVMVLGGFANVAHAAVQVKNWGFSPSGEAVQLITLNSPQLQVELTNYGARIVSIEAPGRGGKRADVVLGYNNLAQYVNDPKDYFGATVGRYGNRIAKGTFSLGGQTYQVPTNNNGNALHGGPGGFSTKTWKTSTGSDYAEFSLVSPDGDMGFPGELTTHVRFTLRGVGLEISYSARSTKTTVVNLTNHAYFNLAGEGSGDILQEKLRIDAGRYTPVDSTLIPTGALPSVAGTAFDFRQSKPIGQEIGAVDQQLQFGGGYDHNWVLNGKKGELHEAAFLEDPASGRTLTIETTEPGLQFYSGNYLNGSAKGFSGNHYEKHGGIALETQHFPDSPNQPSFPSTVLKPGDTYRTRTVLIFGVERGLR